MKSTDFEKIKNIIELLGFNIPENARTEPLIMDKILKNSGIDALALSPLDPSGSLKRLVTESIPLAPLNHLLTQCILEKKPFIQSIDDISKLSVNQLNRKIPKQIDQLTVNIYVALEVLTYLMSNSRELEEAIFLAVMHHRHGDKIGSTWNNLIRSIKRNKGTLFLKLKEISVDPGMFIHLSSRKYFPLPTPEQLQAFIAEHHVRGMNKKFLMDNTRQITSNNQHFFLLSGNILIAMCSEKTVAKDSLDNIKTGLALIHYRELYENDQSFPIFQEAHSEVCFMPKEGFWHDLFSFPVDPHNTLSCVVDMTQEWIDLYMAWDAAFILRTLNEARNFALFALMVPLTFSADPKTYLANRVDSLWLGMALLNDNYPQDFTTHLPKEEWDRILDIFGKNNLHFAQEVLFKHSVDIDALYEQVFGNRSFLYFYWKMFRTMHGKYVTRD